MWTLGSKTDHRAIFIISRSEHQLLAFSILCLSLLCIQRNIFNFFKDRAFSYSPILQKRTEFSEIKLVTKIIQIGQTRFKSGSVRHPSTVLNWNPIFQEKIIHNFALTQFCPSQNLKRYFVFLLCFLPARIRNSHNSWCLKNTLSSASWCVPLGKHTHTPLLKSTSFQILLGSSLPTVTSNLFPWKYPWP